MTSLSHCMYDREADPQTVESRGDRNVDSSRTGMRTAAWRSDVGRLMGILPKEGRRALTQEMVFRAASAWKFLLPIEANSRALVLAMRETLIPLSLENSFREVYVCSGSQRYIALLERWGEKRLVPLHLGGGKNLPLPSGFFDAIVVVAAMDREPHLKWKRISALLPELVRVLTETGSLYVQCEPWGSPAYAALLDEHDDSRLGPNHQRAGSMRTPTHVQRITTIPRSMRWMRRYHRLFSGELGFCGSISSMPDHRRTTEIRFSRRPMTAPFFKGKATVGFLFSRSVPEHGFLNELTRHVLRRLELEPADQTRWALKRYMVCAGGKVLFRVKVTRAGQQRSFIFKLPLNDFSLRRLQNNFDVLRRLLKEWPLHPDEAALVPEGELAGEFEGQPYFVESCLDGVAANALEGDHRRRMISDSIDIIVRLQSATAVIQRLDGQVFERFVQRPLLETIDFAGGDRKSETKELLHYMEGALRGRRLPLVRTHGDYSLKNILVDPRRRSMTGIIDWDLSQYPGLPMLDVLHMVSRARLGSSRLEFRQTMTEKIFPASFSPIEREFLDRYMSVLGIDNDLYLPLAIMNWIHRLHGHVHSDVNLDRVAMEDKYDNVLGGLVKILGNNAG